MIFVLEGPDLCGKTSTAHELARTYNLAIVKPWADLTCAKSSLTSISRTLLSAAAAFHRDVIFDRFITSEYIYGPNLGRDISYLDELLAEWRNIDIRIMQLRLSEQDLEKRYKARGDHIFDINMLRQIRQAYEGLPGLLPSWLPCDACENFDDCRTVLLGHSLGTP